MEYRHSGMMCGLTLAYENTFDHNTNLLKIWFKMNPFTPKRAKFKTDEKNLNFILQICQKQTAPLESTAQQLSFEWSHTRISSTDLKGTTTLID